jgi:hypothetical protein
MAGVMKAAIIKLLASIAVFLLLCIAIGYTKDENWLGAWFLLLIYGAFPVLILAWIDFGHALRNAPSSSKVLFVLGVIFGLPQALLGLLALVAGIAIVGWVLYNSFIARLPEYTGGFLTFGLGPVLALFGLFWLREAFIRQPCAPETQQDAQPDGPASDGGSTA